MFAGADREPQWTGRNAQKRHFIQTWTGRILRRGVICLNLRIRVVLDQMINLRDTRPHDIVKALCDVCRYSPGQLIIY